MVAFALGYQHTGDERYRQGIVDIDRYLSEWMTSARGTFFTNQKNQPKNLPPEMDVADYWLLESDVERRRYGIPPIDRAVHTDKNGAVISAYVLAYESTGDASYLKTAERAARAIVDERMRPGGWLVQTVDHGGVEHESRLHALVTEERPFLSAQAMFGLALLDLYRVTADEFWLTTAKRVADAALERLYDPDSGGFFATVRDSTAAVIAPRKPLEANGAAASFFYDLSIYTKSDVYRPVAERTVRAVGAPDIIRREGKITGEFALALERVTTAYVEFSVVGDRDHPTAKALFDAGLSVFEPRKVLHYEAPGRYPDRGRPAMYICNPDMCTVPIEDPKAVAEQAAPFHGPAQAPNAPAPNATRRPSYISELLDIQPREQLSEFLLTDGFQARSQD